MTGRRERAHRSALDKIGARQRNVLWNEAVPNAVRADAFLWRGSPNPTLLQRIGAALFGLTFLCAGIAFLMLANAHRSLQWMLLAYVFVLLGIRVCRNSFPRPTRKRGGRHSG